MVNIDPTTLGFEFGGGALIGLLMGYAAKKVAKLIAVIIGLQLVVFRYLESRGILIVDWDALSAGILEGAEEGSKQAPSYIETVISTLSVGVGFTGGFLVGFRRG